MLEAGERELEGNEGTVLLNDALKTFYLRLYGVRDMVMDHSAREETRCLHISYSFQLALSHRQDNTYHGLCDTSRGALAGTRIGGITNLGITNLVIMS